MMQIFISMASAIRRSSRRNGLSQEEHPNLNIINSTSRKHAREASDDINIETKRAKLRSNIERNRVVASTKEHSASQDISRAPSRAPISFQDKQVIAENEGKGDTGDGKRKLRSEQGAHYKSELSAYFNEYDEVIGNLVKEKRQCISLLLLTITNMM